MHSYTMHMECWLNINVTWYHHHIYTVRRQNAFRVSSALSMVCLGLLLGCRLLYWAGLGKKCAVILNEFYLLFRLTAHM